MRKILVLIAIVSISFGASKIQEKFQGKFATLMNEECKKGTLYANNEPYIDTYCDCMGKAMAAKLASKFSDSELDFLLDMHEPNFRPNSLKEMDMANKLYERFSQELDTISIESLMDDMVECGRAKGIGVKK